MDNTTHEFVRATFKPGGREYTYKAKPDELAVGDEALTPAGKTLTVTAVKTDGAIVNSSGLALDAASYSWLTKKPAASVEPVKIEEVGVRG